MTVDDYLKLNYSYVITEDTCDDSKCFMIMYPDLPGCMAQGFTVKEAIASGEEAKLIYVETLLDMGLEVPLPKQTVNIEFSTKTTGTFSCNLVIKNIEFYLPEEVERPYKNLPSAYKTIDSYAVS
ncbi:MAG: hypothetical protein A2Y66_02810 [Nitrospirae bacterium RBG_13_41_22]|nr:MAG: hypothetical protein A2Y66_02810 [Nitrospirae bacterium RBG_13_41_22]